MEHLWSNLHYYCLWGRVAAACQMEVGHVCVAVCSVQCAVWRVKESVFDEAQVSVCSGFLGSSLALCLYGRQCAVEQEDKSPSNIQVEGAEQRMHWQECFTHPSQARP